MEKAGAPQGTASAAFCFSFPVVERNVPRSGGPQAVGGYPGKSSLSRHTEGQE